jgi:hypothetical protein
LELLAFGEEVAEVVDVVDFKPELKTAGLDSVTLVAA